MGRDHELWPSAAAAFTQGDHIAFGVDRCVLEAELQKPLEENIRARSFSLNGGAGISVMRFCSANAWSSSALMSSSALINLGLARMA